MNVSHIMFAKLNAQRLDLHHAQVQHIKEGTQAVHILHLPMMADTHDRLLAATSL